MDSNGDGRTLPIRVGPGPSATGASNSTEETVQLNRSSAGVENATEETVQLNAAAVDSGVEPGRTVPTDGTQPNGRSGTEDSTPAGDSTGGPAGGTKQKPKKKGSFWKELPILIVVALLLTFLIQTFIARVYIIPSGSMEQTLHGCPGCTGDRILVDKVGVNFGDPEPGDVVVFRAPNGWARSEFQVDRSENAFVHWVKEFGAAIGLGPPQEYDLVKRVIAVGGQTVSCCDEQNRVMVDGEPLNEPYVYWQPGTGGPTEERNRFEPVKVPKDTVWVMGDNRNNSYDSRFQNGGGTGGVVPLDNVIGEARTIIWPPGRWSGVGDPNPQAPVQGGGGGSR